MRLTVAIVLLFVLPNTKANVISDALLHCLVAASHRVTYSSP